MRPIPLLLILSALALPALSQAAVRGEVLQNRLAQPWGMAFLPDDQGILITLRGGELKRWQPKMVHDVHEKQNVPNPL